MDPTCEAPDAAESSEAEPITVFFGAISVVLIASAIALGMFTIGSAGGREAHRAAGEAARSVLGAGWISSGSIALLVMMLGRGLTGRILALIALLGCLPALLFWLMLTFPVALSPGSF